MDWFVLPSGGHVTDSDVKLLDAVVLSGVTVVSTGAAGAATRQKLMHSNCYPNV